MKDRLLSQASILVLGLLFAFGCSDSGDLSKASNKDKKSSKDKGSDDDPDADEDNLDEDDETKTNKDTDEETDTDSATDTESDSDTGTDDKACSGATTNYAFTGAVQTFTVPAGCKHAEVTANGAAGGGFPISTGLGGPGGQVVGKITLEPGKAYTVIVGGGGSNASNQSPHLVTISQKPTFCRRLGGRLHPGVTS